MKRLALVLGSLLVVTAATSAKEVVPAPIIVEEAPVQIVEKEVIVYREKAPEWRPTGNVSLQYKYYGKTENNTVRKSVKGLAKDGIFKPEEKNYTKEEINEGIYKEDLADYNDAVAKNAWNSDNRYSRVQLAGNVNMTPEDNFNFRVRNWNSLDRHSLNQTKTGTETRLRLTHDYGVFGGVDTAARVEYKRTASAQHVEARGIFDFSSYLFNNDYVKTTTFALEPAYRYTWNNSNSDDYTNQLELKLGTEHELPFGFAVEANLYAKKLSMGQTKERDGRDGYKNAYHTNTIIEGELYLRNHQDLYTNDDFTVAFDVEAGYDPYTIYNQKDYDTRENDAAKRYHRSYELKLEPTLSVEYKATKFVTLNGGLGAEYRNWENKLEHTAKNWRWQPYAFAGFNVAF